MQRIIEEFIEKRKKAQSNLELTLKKLSDTFNFTFLRKKKKEVIKGLFLELNNNINELVLSSNKEWDSYSNNHMSGVIQSLNTKILKLEADQTNSKHILNNFLQLEKGLDTLIEKINNINKNDKNENLKNIEDLKKYKEKLSLYQYSDFEQRFRGDENKIREKLEKYYTHFENLNNILDIGCGRGEFLQILKDNEKDSVGIDISESMLKIAKSKDLECFSIDALEYLKGKENNTIGGIFSSQVIEHFTPDYLREVVKESFRVLKPGSIIMLETINPLSLFALSRIFYLDITHQKPLHPEYMRYLLESSGFFDVEIIYSEGDLNDEKLSPIAMNNEIANVFNTNVDKLNNILYSSVEYIVKGIKK